MLYHRRPLPCTSTVRARKRKRHLGPRALLGSSGRLRMNSSHTAVKLWDALLRLGIPGNVLRARSAHQRNELSTRCMRRTQLSDFLRKAHTARASHRIQKVRTCTGVHTCSTLCEAVLGGYCRRLPTTYTPPEADPSCQTNPSSERPISGECSNTYRRKQTQMSTTQACTNKLPATLQIRPPDVLQGSCVPTSDCTHRGCLCIDGCLSHWPDLVGQVARTHANALHNCRRMANMRYVVVLREFAAALGCGWF